MQSHSAAFLRFFLCPQRKVNEGAKAYPMYDYAHGQSDSIENVTHSMCTLEFADHQPLYRWFVEQLGIFPSQQIEFDRLNLTYTLLSKRKLLQLVQEGRVYGWDDPRMPTLSGIRRRGFTPEGIRAFVASLGATRANGIIDFEMLEHFQRDDLNKRATRGMAVLRPLKLVIDNYPEGQTEYVEVANNPEDSMAGTRCQSAALKRPASAVRSRLWPSFIINDLEDLKEQLPDFGGLFAFWGMPVFSATWLLNTMVAYWSCQIAKLPGLL